MYPNLNSPEGSDKILKMRRNLRKGSRRKGNRRKGNRRK
jgi:hypothetical protein